MSLNPSSGADTSTNSVDVQVQRGIDGDALLSPALIAEELAAAYDAYAKQGALPGADLTQGGNIAILEAGFITNNSTAGIRQIAEAICDYWATNNAPGAPAHGGSSVANVVIDGASSYDAMEASIISILTDQLVVDGWLNFYQATEAVVNVISCTITELIQPGSVPTDFAETIS